MNYHQYWKKFKSEWRAIIVIILVVMAISLVTSLTRQPLYRAKCRVLVTQDTSLNMDMYKASQSAERLAILLAKVIKSSAFFKDVLNSGFPIDQTYFSANEKDLREDWAQMVDSRVSTDTSIIEIDVYHPKKKEAKTIANAIIYVFADKGKKYYNVGDQVEIVVIDTPLVSERPEKPATGLNLVLSFLIGLVLGGLYVILSGTRPSRLHKEKVKKDYVETKFPPELPQEEPLQRPRKDLKEPQATDQLPLADSLNELRIIDK